VKSSDSRIKFPSNFLPPIFHKFPSLFAISRAFKRQAYYIRCP